MHLRYGYSKRLRVPSATVAKKWSDEEKQELAVFVQTLFVLSPFRSWAEFAKVADVHPVSISRWQQGQDAPEGYNLLKLLRASGAFDLLQAAAQQRDKERLHDPPEELAEVAVALLEEIRAGFAAIGDRLAALETERTAEAAPPAPKASRKRKAG